MSLKTLCRRMCGKPVQVAGMTAVIGFGIPQADAADLYRQDFEAGTLNLSSIEVDGGCYTQNRYGYDSLSFASTPTKSGSKAVRVEVRGGDYGVCGDWTDGKIRTELGHAIGLSTRYQKMGETKWYAFSFQLGTYPMDSVAVLLWQLVKKDGSGPELHLMTVKNQLRVKERWSKSGGQTTKSLLSLSKDKWYRVVIQHKRSTGSDGFTKLWVNASSSSSSPAFSYKGPTAFGTAMPYVKHGLYTGDKGLIGSHVVYFDDVSIGGSGADFGSVNSTSIATAPTAPKRLSVQ